MPRIPLPFVLTVAVVFFSLTLSHARVPANIPGDEVIGGELPNSLPESDVNPIIRLPSDAESVSNEPVRETQESESLTVQSVPLSVVRFRPVDHQFRLRSRSPFPCRHHHHHHRMFMPMRQHPEIPYGDDMILTSGENADFHPGMFHGGVRRIPARWVKFHHQNHHDNEDEHDGIPKLMFKHSDMFDKDKFKNHKRRHHHHHEEDEEDKEVKFKEHEERKEEGGGFMKRIRKILDHF